MLRLYVWDHVEALGEWAPGLAFALADSKEQAIELILAVREDDGGGEAPMSIENLRRELACNEPDVLEEPIGFAKWGSA